VVVAASERQPPEAAVDPGEPPAALDENEIDTHPIEAARPFLTAVPPPPEEAEAEPALADAPPPLPEDAAGPVAFEDEPPLGPLDEPAAPVAEEDLHTEVDPGATQPFDPVADWEEEDAAAEDAEEPPMRLELQADEDDEADDDDDTVER
jgi:hypothetical protein